MINQKKFSAYKTLHILSHNTEAVLTSLFTNHLKVKFEPFKIYSFSLNGFDYSVSQKNNSLFSDDPKSKVPILIILSGSYLSEEDFYNNLDKTLISFPLWFPNDKMEAEIKGLSDFKHIILDNNYFQSNFNDLSRKYISLNLKLTLPIIKIFASEIKYLDIVDYYSYEVNYIHELIISNLDLLRKKMPKFIKSDEYEDYEDYGNPIVYSKYKEFELWAASSDSHLYAVLKDKNLYKIFYIDKDKHYQFDEDDNPIHKIDIESDDIIENKKGFINWLLTENKTYDISFDDSGFFDHKVLETTLENTFYKIEGEILEINSIYPIISENNIILNAEMFNYYDLGHENFENKVGWVFLGQGSYEWKKGGIFDSDSLFPFRIYKPLIKIEQEMKPACVISEDTNALIQNIPDDVDKSFLPLLKMAYLMLEKNEDDRFHIEDFDIKSIKSKLIKLGVEF